MKRLLALLCALLLLTVSVSAAAAFFLTHEVPELHMEIDLPMHWYVLTRQAEEDNPGLYFYEDDLDYMLESFTASDVYLNAFDIDGLYEMILIMQPDEDTFDLAVHDSETVDEFAFYYADNPVWVGDAEVNCFRSDDFWYTDSFHNELRFVTYNRTETYDGDILLNCFQMSTVFNGQAMHFILTSYDDMVLFGELSEILYDIVDSIKFTEYLPAPDRVFEESPDFFEEEAEVFDPEESIAIDTVITEPSGNTGVILAGVFASIMPAIILFVIARLSVRAKKRRASRPTAQPMRRATPPKSDEGQSRQAEYEELFSKEEAFAEENVHSADAGRPVQKKAAKRPKHNCSDEGGEVQLTRSNETVYCLNCGKKVYVRQGRCPRCGTRVI